MADANKAKGGDTDTNKVITGRADTLEELEEQLRSVTERLAATLERRNRHGTVLREARNSVETLTKQAHTADATDPEAAQRYREERLRKRAAFREAELGFERENTACARLEQRRAELERSVATLRRHRRRTRRSRRRIVRFGLKPTEAAKQQRHFGPAWTVLAIIFLLVSGYGGLRFWAARTPGYVPEADRRAGLEEVTSEGGGSAALRLLGVGPAQAPDPVRRAPPRQYPAQNPGSFDRLSPVISARLGRPEAYGLPEDIHGVASGDFDGDGIPELVHIDFDGQRLITYRRTGTAYTLASTVDTGPWPNDLAVGDLNGDGRADAVVVHGDGAVLVLLSGEGDGMARRDLGRGGAGTTVRLADLNGDGALDIVATGGTATELFEGDGTGKFLGPLPVHRKPEQAELVVADFNADGILDVATHARWDPATYRAAVPPKPAALHITLLAPDLLPLGETKDEELPTPLMAAGAIDLVAPGSSLAVLRFGAMNRQTRQPEYVLTLLANRGDGTFTHVDCGPVTTGAGLTVVDVNGDGRTDVLAGLRVFLNDGSSLNRHPSGIGLGEISAYWRGDFTGDDAPDVLARLAGVNRVLLFPAVRG